MKKRLLGLIAALFALMTFAYAADELLVAPSFGQTEARSMLDMINAFRTGDEAHYWNESDTAQVSSKGEPLAYSYALEEIAMQRAAEIALSFSHTRPDGTICFNATASDGTRSWGENIAAGSSTASGAFAQWREDDDHYAGQGHRRNMLNQNFSAIGIGHVVLNGTHYWAQEFSYSADSAPATDPADAARTVTIEAASGRIQSAGNLQASQSEMELATGESAALPAVSVSVRLSEAWPGRETTVKVNPVWTSGNASVCTVDGQQVSGVAAGTAVLTGAALGKTVAVSVTVSGAGGEPTPTPSDGAHAIFYEDGTLVFQNGDAPEPGRAVTKTYEVDLTAAYTDESPAPWYEKHYFIRVASFADKVSPTSTAYWFSDCRELERIDGIENLDTSHVTSMRRMFNECSALTALDVSGFDTSNVTDMSRMFAGCEKLETLDVSGFNTANVTEMGGIFSACSSLTALDVSGFDTAKAASMSGMFSGCKNLAALDVSNFNTAKVISMDWMFSNCAALTTLDLSGFNTAKVKYMASMFSGSSNLKTVYASDKFKNSAPLGGEEMFLNCASLVGGNGTRYDENHTNKEYARIDTASAPGYFTDKDAPAPADGVYAILYEDGTLVFQNGNAPETGKTVAKIYPVDLNAVYSDDGQPAAPWYDLSASIRVVNFADAISPVSIAFWFCSCYNLTKIDNIQNLDTSNVVHMFGAFVDCRSLTELDVSHFNTAQVTSMSGTFCGCSSLTELDLSGFDTANVKDMDFMFEGCSALKTLDLSGFNTANVLYMRHMFDGCSGLTALDLSDFDTANVQYMVEMFCGCNRLKTVYASDKFTTAAVNEAGEYQGSQNMFFNCASLVGGAGTKYDESHIDKEYARIDAASAPGYFADKSVYAIADAEPDTDAGTLSVTLTNPGAATLAAACFDKDGRFLSVDLQSVEANAGTVTLALAADAKTARVMLLDSDCRPLCACFETPIG